MAAIAHRMRTRIRRGAAAALLALVSLEACKRAGHESSRVRPAPSTDLPKAVEEHGFIAPAVGFYAVFLPPDYGDAATQTTRYPLVVILHGNASTELLHGALSDDLGRQGVIYVAPRAPYAAPDAFIDEHTPGWTAWPTYPEVWGQEQAPQFPKIEVQSLNVERLYTDWIAAAIADARRRYRVAPERAVVLGHSQGGTFAHRFAVEHPDLVRAYVAIAGRHRVDLANRADASVLREHGIHVLVLHNEGDPVVPVKHSRDLVAYLDANHVTCESMIAPGGDHRVSPSLRKRAREFVRRECGLAE